MKTPSFARWFIGQNVRRLLPRATLLSVALAALAPGCARPGRSGTAPEARWNGASPPQWRSAGRGTAAQSAREAPAGVRSSVTPPPAPGPSAGDGTYGPSPAARPAPSHASRAPQPASRRLGSAEMAPPQPRDRPGLGTTFGERLQSRVRYTPFVRASNRPAGLVSIHYNDRQGLYAMARYLRRTCCAVMPAMRMGAGITVRLTDGQGRPLRGIQIGGRTIVLGHHGQRYAIEVQNHTGRRWEVVASVDGLDVVDGRPANLQKRGYILPPWGRLWIQGYRTSTWTVAAFRFGSVRNAYATRTTGSSRNVGVVGVAVFAEQQPRWSRAEVLRRLRARPFGPSPFAQPPR